MLQRQMQTASASLTGSCEPLALQVFQSKSCGLHCQVCTRQFVSRVSIVGCDIMMCNVAQVSSCRQTFSMQHNSLQPTAGRHAVSRSSNNHRRQPQYQVLQQLV